MMKAFSFLTILESLSKKLSILRTKMHSDDLRVDYESITSQLRVSRPFSRTSFGASRRVSHFAAILTILFTVGVGNVWGAEYALVSNPTGTPALTTNFRYGNLTLNKSTAATIDGIGFKKGIGFGGTLTSISGKEAGDNNIMYDVKTTSTKFTVYVSGGTGTLYFSKIAEGATSTTVENKTISSNPQKIEFTLSSTTNTCVGFSLNNANIYIYQIIAEETGTAHKQAGEAGYQLNLNKGRYAGNKASSNSGKSGSIDNVEFATYDKIVCTSSTAIQLNKNSADTYIKFTTGASAVNLKVTFSAGTLIANTSKSTSGGTSLTSNTAQALAASTTYWIINTNSGNRASISKIAFEAASGVTNPSFSPATGSSLVKSTGTVTLTSSGNTVYYKWSQTDNQYASGAGATLAGAADGSGTSPVNATAPSTAGTWYLYAVAKNGGDYSDVVKATYTITNPTHTVTAATDNASYGTAAAASTTVAEGGTTTITATPKTGYQFDHWTVSGTGATLSSTSTNPTTLTMGTANATVTAYFVVDPCSAWGYGTANTTAPSSGNSVTVGDLTVANVGCSTSSTTPFSGGTSTGVILGNGASKYITGTLGGDEIESIRFSIYTTDASKSTYVVAFSSSATYDAATVLKVSGDYTAYFYNDAPAATGTRKDVEVTAPAGAKSFAIGRNLSGVSHGGTEQNSGSRGVYYIAACPADAPSCTAPSSVTVTPTNEFGWRYSIGETISLTATPTGGSGNYTYQWQKYIGDTWTDIAGATAATYTKTNCTTGDGGSYRCVVSTGNDCSYESEGYFVRVFTLNGGYTTDGEWTAHKIDWTDENTGVVTISLPVSKTYYFKVTDNDGKWFGYGDASNYIIQPWQADCGTGNSNIRLFTGPAGDYKFTINIEHAQENSPYVNIKVDYPEVTHPVAGYAYINKWWDCYVHYWEGASNALTAWGSDPKINDDRYVNICGTDYWYFPVIETYTNFIAKDKAGDPANTTGDQSTTNHSGQNITHKGSAWVWQEFSTYSITFNGNGNTGGSMTNVTGITCGGSATLTQNTFTRTGYTFDGWATAADGEKVYDDKATISNITSDITLYAKWTANIYTITYNLGPEGEGWEDGYTPAPTYTAGVEYTLPTSDNLNNVNYGTFQGWYENNTFTGDAVTTIPADATGDKTYYAKWVYDIQFFEVVDEETDVHNKEFTNPLEGSYPTTYTYGIGITLPALPAKDGYTEDGWYSQWCVCNQETNGLGWVDACKFTALANDAYGNVNFAVKYTANTYTITWNANGGNVTPASSTYTYGGEIVTLPTPTRDDYTFNGWFTETTGGTQITEIGTTNKPTSNVTYYAQWTENATPDPEPEGDYCINLGLGEAPTTANGGIPSELNNVIVTLTSTGSKSTWNEDGYLNLGANDDYITFDFTNVGKITKVSFDVTIPNWAADKNKIEYKFNDAAKYTEKTISSAAKEIITLEAPENTNKFTFSREAGTGTRISSICFTLAPTTPTPDNCGISECGNATLTYTINASTNTTNTADNLLSSATASNTAALEVNDNAVFSNITASEAGKAAAATNECFNPAPVMSSKITMHKGSSYNANTYLQFTFTVKSGYTFTPCDVQFIVQPVMTAANFRWVITNGTTEYGSGTANDVPVGQGNGATALLGLSSTSAMPAGTYYIRLYPYDNDDNSFRISNDVILKGTIEEVVCTTPDAPTAFAVGSITSNGATFTITDAANTNNYEIYYSTSNTAPTAETEATITTTEKTKAVTGLTAETTYYAWVRAVCNEENKSSWVALTNNSFTTSAELTPGDCVTIFEAKATGESPFFSATTGTITSPSFAESNELDVDGYSHAAKPDGALKIDPKAGETFRVGDKLTFVVYTAKDKEIGFKIGNNTYTQSVNKSLYYFEQELKETDITDGATTITFNRNSADDRWVAVKIERCAQLPPCTTPVLSDLENQKVCPGSDVTWTAIVNNTATLQENGETITYQWTKNSTVLSNDATLTLNDITEAAGGTYVVTATVSADGKASATATKEVTLTVTPATATPTITASANTIFAGNSVTLTASCASSGVTYQWYTCNDAEGNGESAIDNAKNAEYTPSTATVGTYYYKVIVTGDGTNSCGTAEKVYELVVKTPSAGCYDMIIFDSSNDQTIPAVDATGTEANTGASWANVGTSTNSDPCTYTYNDKTYKKGWKFVSGSTSSDNRYIQFVIPEGYTGSLFLAAYSTSTNRTVFIDTKPTKTVNNTYASVHISATGTLGTASAVLNPGTYYVCATDGLHLVELSIEICSDVNCTDPQVTATVNNVNNAIVCEGTENVTFTATNYANGAEFQWQKKDGNTWEEINGATSATYTISSVTTAHAGQYRVIAHNVCDRISKEVTLTVLTAPEFNDFAKTASVMKGNALAISDVQATNATGYAWYKSSDNSLDAAEDTKVGTSKDLLLAAASIPEAADQTFYLFCVATNSCGSVTSNAITVTVTPFVEEECATKGNEGDHEFGFTNTGCGDDTYGDSKTPVWKTNSRKKYLTYTAPEGRYFATAKVTVAHTGGTKCGYAYSTDGGTTWVVKELDGLSTTLTAITIELSELSENVNAFRISRNLTAQDGEKGSDSETFYLAEACFTYKNACTETTLTVGLYDDKYNMSVQMGFVEPTFTLKSGETTLEGQTLTYTSSNPAIATVDEEGNVEFEGMTGTVTITATYAGGTIEEVDYCASQGSYTITVGCKDAAPKIFAADGTNLGGCNASITLLAKMEDGTAFADGTFQWYRDGEAIEGATSASYIVVRAGTYTVSRTDACIKMSLNSAVVTNENVEPQVERLTPFQYYHVDKTYSDQMKDRHLFAVKSYGILDGKRYHLTATKNGETTLNLSSSNAFFTIPSSDNAVDTVMINLNELKDKYAEGDEIVITCAPINNCNTASAITTSITIHVIGDKPTLALICSGADGEGTRATKELVVGGDFLTGYNKADLCQQTGNTTFDPNTEWGFYTELKKKYIVTPVNGYAEFNKLNYEPFDILLFTDYPKASKSEAAATILDDMAALCDYRPLLSLKAHMVAKTPSKWAAKGFTTSPVVPAATSQYANIVCYAHPMFDELDDAHVEGIYHDHDDFNQLVYQILTGPGHESSKGLQGFELKDADNFVTIGLIHYNAAAEVVTHKDGDDTHAHLEWTPAADDRQLVAIAERQANIEARMILFAINCGAQSMQTPMGRQVLLTCLDYLLKTDLIEVADCRLTFDNGEGNTNWDESAYEGTGKKGDGLWSTAANWGPEYMVVPGRNNDVRIAAPCTVDANGVEVLSVHITEDGSLTIPADKSFTARSTILRADEKGNVYPTNVEDISLGSDAGGNASLILNNERGDTKATVQMYSTADADTENYSAAASTWQYIGTPHSDVKNAVTNYYNSWLYQYDTGTQGWVVIPNGGPLVPFRGYCVTHPESPHTYWMEGTLTATTNQDITIPANKFVVVANSWTAPIQIHELTDDDMEGLKEKTIYFFNTGKDPEGDNSVTQNATGDARWATGTYISVPIHAADYTGEDTNIPSMQGFYVVGGETDGTLHLDYERHVRAPRKNTPSRPMHAPARRVAADNEPQVAKFLFRGTRYDDRLIILERPDFTRGYDSGWDGEQWGGNAAAPMSYVVTEARWDAVSAIPEYEGTVIGFRAGEDSEYTIHFDYDGMEDALYLLDTDTQIYTRVLKGNSYTFTCTDKAEHNRFILTRKAPQIATGTDHINTGENAKAVKFIKDDKIFIFVNGTLYDATGKMVIR